ncbi:flagellar biosynthetic protein FlhB [Brevibacillus reuszeri]|uniref:Flagellar biosynthetic protein FlhB n=1 Tax=Brevibacillus reuszeri TaxID=54915 RepID=A0A0K9YWY0_9BACL|nr:flagellar biosynthesis protein FlhB [Brevibacillus reuszeri]KNB72740.1 flagellar biosynthesis protein FlhB [Brevibacillus reuszeri]MED1860555.1 flagellar biosynthesis protein FlhB [Brevibacillus reuszeri]GED70224.1 flagellar biosynthetic protein FlhB [Brevibacillus reuszeri]
MKQIRFAYPIDLQFFNGEKTEKATPKKKQDARKKGQVAKSQDLSASIALTAFFFLLMMLGSTMLGTFQTLVRESLTTYTTWQVNEENLKMIVTQVAFEAVKVVGPVLALSFLVAFGVNYMQVGWHISTEALQMKLEKLDPIKGAKRIFSMRSIVELLKSILKISAGIYVAYTILWNEIEQILQLSLKSLGNVLSFTAAEVAKLGIYLGLLLFILAILDYAYQRYEHEKNLRMSKQDLKDEHKQAEGDPLIKGKIRERQRSMAIRRMMQELPKADVIITNPTHFAVAIRYDSSAMSAPTVVAKGQDYLALKIREVAKKHRIITMENKPLARALYSQVEIGQQIPEELFKAVAEVLAYVYKLQGKAK